MDLQTIHRLELIRYYNGFRPGHLARELTEYASHVPAGKKFTAFMRDFYALAAKHADRDA